MDSHGHRLHNRLACDCYATLVSILIYICCLAAAGQRKAGELGGEPGIGSVVDVSTASEIVAGLLAAGGVKELGEVVGRGLVAGIVERVRKVFGSDARSVDALERAHQNGSAATVAELASALSWYAGRDPMFAEELAGWAVQAGDVAAVSQQVIAGGDAFVAGRDQTFVNFQRPSK